MTIKRIIKTMNIKATTNEGGVTRVIASTPDVDRYGDIVGASWDLSKFEANPVIVWGHDYQTPPVGRAESVRLDGDTLVADIRWDESPDNELGRLVASQFKRGFLNSVSVGFQPGSATPRNSLPDGHPARGQKGYFYEQNQLMEISAVVIPANPQALARRSVQADIGVQRHIVEVVENEDSWTVTFEKYPDHEAEEPPAEEPPGEAEQYSRDDEDEDDKTMSADPLTTVFGVPSTTTTTSHDGAKYLSDLLGC